jgi:xanthine dehydrogenase YagT iron-sulfur-binding subunit
LTKSLITLRVNGEPHTVAAEPHHTLLEVLREELGLTGTKHGCELGECGACTVLVDGMQVLSCLVLPQQIGMAEVTTV